MLIYVKITDRRTDKQYCLEPRKSCQLPFGNVSIIFFSYRTKIYLSLVEPRRTWCCCCFSTSAKTNLLWSRMSLETPLKDMKFSDLQRWRRNLVHLKGCLAAGLVSWLMELFFCLSLSLGSELRSDSSWLERLMRKSRCSFSSVRDLEENEKGVRGDRRSLGLVVWFLLRVQEVPSSIPGETQFFFVRWINYITNWINFITIWINFNIIPIGSISSPYVSISLPIGSILLQYGSILRTLMGTLILLLLSLPLLFILILPLPIPFSAELFSTSGSVSTLEFVEQDIAIEQVDSGVGKL